MTEKERIESLEKLLRIAGCPEELIKNPQLLSFKQPSEGDIEWAKNYIKAHDNGTQGE